MHNQKCIGGKHTPEKLLFKKLKNIHDKKLRKAIEKQWKELEECGYIIRMKKRTKKGMDFHVCLNPKTVFIIREMIRR